MQPRQKNLLILTSTFPRWSGDTDPPFVFELCSRLSSHFTILAIAPHAVGTRAEEVYRCIHVRRFRYFFGPWESLSYDGGILNRLRQNRWRYMLVPFFVLGELFMTSAVLLRQTISLMNAHWLIPQGLVGVLAKALSRSPVPLVCTVHGGDIFALNSPLLTGVKRFVLSRSAAVIVVSRAIQKEIVSLGIPENHVHVIPMGVDLRSRFIPPQKPRAKGSLLFVGRLVEKKGVRYLLDAMPQVLQAHPEARLTIVGQGPDEAELRGIISSRGLQDAVCMTGAVENTCLPERYQSAEIIIFPSIVDQMGDTEGFGLVLVEALGCECAAIASDLPAVHDIIIDQQTGLLVEQKNSRQLAEKIIYLLDNPAMQQALGRAGRRYVLERYDWTITADRHRTLFDSLMQDSGGA